MSGTADHDFGCAYGLCLVNQPTRWWAGMHFRTYGCALASIWLALRLRQAREFWRFMPREEPSNISLPAWYLKVSCIAYIYSLSKKCIFIYHIKLLIVVLSVWNALVMHSTALHLIAYSLLYVKASAKLLNVCRSVGYRAGKCSEPIIINISSLARIYSSLFLVDNTPCI